MSLIIQKFGGTSVSNSDSLKTVAKRITECKDAGNEVVVVVSAMGSSTDELIELASELTNEHLLEKWICSCQLEKGSLCLSWQYI